MQNVKKTMVSIDDALGTGEKREYVEDRHEFSKETWQSGFSILEANRRLNTRVNPGKAVPEVVFHCAWRAPAAPDAVIHRWLSLGETSYRLKIVAWFAQNPGKIMGKIRLRNLETGPTTSCWVFENFDKPLPEETAKMLAENESKDEDTRQATPTNYVASDDDIPF